MKYRRYGTFHPKDYCVSWIGIAVLLIFAGVSLPLDLPFVFVVFPIAYATVWLYAIFKPNFETFSIQGNVIEVINGKKRKKIIIPPEVTLIVSYVDICPPFAVKASFGNQTHVLKDKYAISILRKMPLEIILQHLHRNYIEKYTTSTVKTFFDGYCFVYSFVCDQKLLEKVIQNRNYNIVIPESLKDKVSIDIDAINVYIDVGY